MKEEELKEHALQIKALMNENILMKNKNKDLIDENEMLKTNIMDLEKCVVKKMSSRSSQSSMSEELKQAQILRCGKCNCVFVTPEELIKHLKVVHERRNILENKLNDAEKNVLKQKNDLTSSIFELNQIETISSQKCNCKVKPRSFCKINHQRYNFVNFESANLYLEFTNL